MTFDLSNHGPFELSRLLERCAESVRRFERHGGAHPFGSAHFPGKSTFDAVLELHPSDPMRIPLLRAVHRLTETRIVVPFLTHERQLIHADQIRLVEPVDGSLSRHEMRVHLLRASGKEQLAWSRSWARHERALSDHRLQLFQAYKEISERIGVPDPMEFWDPLGSAGSPEVEVGAAVTTPSAVELLAPAAAPQATRAAKMRELAMLLLQQSHDAAQQVMNAGWEGFLSVATGHEAGEGWPARLAPDALRALLNAPELLRGVELDPGPLPERAVPASFPRALAQVGRALSWALAPRHVPFVVRHDGEDLRGHFAASLLLFYSCSDVFLKKVLGLSGARLERTSRALSGALLAHLRLSAVRAALLSDLFGPQGTALESYQELSAQLLLGEDLPPSSALGRFSVRRDEAARFSGLLWAAAVTLQLTEEYDEDFWRNPRMQQWLRAELSQPAALTVQPEVAQRGAAAALAATVRHI